MRDLDDLFAALGRSRFRCSFRLNAQDAAYLHQLGLDVASQHAAGFVRERLAPAQPANDGRQTPWRGHPVFVAQHATATCCRSCLSKWCGIEQGQPITSQQVDDIVQVMLLSLEFPCSPSRAQYATARRTGLTTGSAKVRKTLELTSALINPR